MIYNPNKFIAKSFVFQEFLVMFNWSYIVALFVVPLFYALLAPSKTRGPLPPGPRKLPVVKNLFNMPSGGFIWLKYARMCGKYSE